MPSSAQNEYIRVYAKEGRSTENDCNVLATLARGIENGTLFDIIFGDTVDGKPDYEFRPLSLRRSDGNLVSALEDTPKIIPVPMTSKQYEGLSAIQLEIDRIEDDVRDSLPPIEVDGLGYINEGIYGHPICTPDGYRYKATANENDEIVSIERSTDKIQEDDYIRIDWNTAQKLIGIKLS